MEKCRVVVKITVKVICFNLLKMEIVSDAAVRFKAPEMRWLLIIAYLLDLNGEYNSISSHQRF
ncbi:hypothetical protein [Acinetobacter ursingii]|uniref:hypothetical protein n=1 Tax=Acinetobacter ursingii TaxID=108980 RepID=UPI00124D134C|nr:hypothetical protein [Acinetobacter ursingii]